MLIYYLESINDTSGANNIPNTNEFSEANNKQHTKLDTDE